MVGERFGPERVDLEARRLYGGLALGASDSVDRSLRETKCNDEGEQRSTHQETAICLHVCLRFPDIPNGLIYTLAGFSPICRTNR